MRQSIKYEITVMLHKKEFILAFCFMLLFTLSAFLYACRGQWGVEISQVMSANYLYVGQHSNAAWGLFMYLICFVVVLPHAMSYINDLETGTFSLAIVRSNKFRYYISKNIAAFLGNFIIIFIPFLLNLIFCHMTFSEQPNYAFGEYGLPNYFRTITGSNSMFVAQMRNSGIPFIGLFVKSPTLYCLLYLFLLSVAAGVLGNFVLCISFFLKKHRVFLFLPVYLLVIFSGVATSYSEMMARRDANRVYTDYNLMDYLGILGYKGQDGRYIAVLLAVIGVFCMIAIWRAIRSDELIDVR